MESLDQPRRPSRGYGILRALLALLIGITVISCVLIGLLGGFVDFPCFVEYDRTGDCISMEHARGRWDEVQADTRNRMPAGWSSSGILAHKSHSSRALSSWSFSSPDASTHIEKQESHDQTRVSNERSRQFNNHF